MRPLKKSNKPDNAQVNPDPNSTNLPHSDIVLTDILPKLPPKSLIRFKCVSKPWLSTISSPHFAKSYSQLSLSRSHNHGMLIQVGGQLYAIPNYANIDYGSENFDLDQHKVAFDHHGIDGSFQLVDSCNGLVCLRLIESRQLRVRDPLLLSGPMRIWNPFTRQCREVPRPLIGNFEMSIDSVMWAFGYINDDYKLVYIMLTLHLSGCRVANLVRVYSLRTGEWTEFETTSLVITHLTLTSSQTGVFLPNGKAHWFVQECVAGNYDKSVLVYDLVAETFENIPVPDNLCGDDTVGFYKNGCIGAIEEDLCIVSLDSSQCLQVWMLESYGDGGSWKKFMKLCLRTSPSTRRLSFCNICRIRMGGEVLVCVDGDVWLVGRRNEIVKCVRITSYCIRMTRFVSTLISPFMQENL